MFATLRLVGISSLLALAVALPSFLAGVPCISSTSPPNSLGGKLGSLTDLSLLRLLNALDPSPGSSSSSNAIHLPAYARNLSSTISPAIGFARTRLIILLVIIAIVGCGGGLFVVARGYTTLRRYRKHFLGELCGGLEIIIIPATEAKAWQGVSEEGVKRWLTERTRNGGQDDLEIVGLFAIPCEHR